jgi:2-polyprenyl-6-methoxyphenol hydroxylase-like FAD-dependent oxidoreductase
LTLEQIAQDGMSIGKFKNGSVDLYGNPACRIRRSRLHEILINALRDFPELVTVNFGKKAVSVASSPEAATVSFADGTSATGDFVVGADGLHSAIRKSVLGESAPKPAFQSVVSIGGFTSTSRLVDQRGKPYPLPCLMFGRTGTIGFMPFGSQGEDISSWFVTLEVDTERDRTGWEQMRTSGEALDIARKQLDGWEGPICGLIQEAKDSPESCLLWPQYAVGDIPAWHTDRVILIGDAAHALPPSGGQGAAQAFEDAELLSRVFLEGGSLTRWEAERRSRITLVTKFTGTSGASRKVGKASALQFAFKKYGMWVYFHLFGCGRWDELYQYDGTKAPLES